MIGTFCIFYLIIRKKIINMEHCFIKCDHNICTNFTQLRDSNYSMNNTQPYDCVFTLWESSHMLFHVFIGYYFNIYISVIISVFYEIFEHCFYNCGSYLDLFWNGLGLLIGVIIRHYSKYNK